MPRLPRPARDEDGNDLARVGWYCWRCRDIRSAACRSDAVPIYVSAEWVPDMGREIAEKEN